MYFFQGHLNKDLYNNGLIGSIWMSNDKTSSGYAPECKSDSRKGLV
jgi:hypothetical protein